MDFSEEQIARLVLGYLKSEKCKQAFQEFLRTSPHFKDDTKSERIKYMVTRVSGLSLVDYLREYCDIYTLVQGRLEATDYFSEHHSRTTLLEQLQFLLDKLQCSRTSTPCPRTPEIHGSTPIDQLSDVEATPAHTLPGNIAYDDSYAGKTPKRKGTRGSKPESLMPQDELAAREVLSKTLIENKEFTERLAQTINIVRSTPEIVEKKTDENISAGVYAELDATIKTVVRKTEEDPIFEKILDEIIGTSAVETNATKVNQNKPNQQSMEEQNNEAVRSIIVASNSKDNVPKVDQLNNDVMVFNGNMDNFLKTAQPITNVQSKDMYPNTSLLVMPNQNYSFDPSKQILLVNQPLVMPQITATGNIITEQDILSMPTVILNDSMQTTVQPPPQSILISKPTTSQAKPIASKAVLTNDIQANLGEYVRFHKAEPVSKTPKAIKTMLPKTKGKQIKKKPRIIKDATVTISIVENGPVEQEKSIIEDIKTEVKEPQECIALDCSNEHPVEPPKHDKTPAASKLPCRRPTPKSGSHVRNLNFSTPPKLSISEKKKTIDKSSSPKFVQKKQAAKTLFKTEVEPTKPSKNIANVKKTKLVQWDSELRVLASSNADSMKPVTPKRKTKPPPKERSKKKAKANDLNLSVEKGGMILEAALQTPEKKVSDKQENLNKVKKTDAPKAAITDDLHNEPLTERKPSLDKLPLKTDCAEDLSTKTILSPSKLNANKRNLVSEEPNKLITPEMRDKEQVCYPMKAIRNITPLLETPIKTDVPPKTPGLRTPGTGFTPFNKVIDEHLQGIDINALETPNLPLTPNFPPFTPNVDFNSPYANRPTDYSGSSSYYQPSDTEHNKSLEQLIEETKTKKVVTTCKKSINIIENVVIESGIQQQDIQKHLNVFNKNIIGKKNLNLVNRNVVKSSSSSSSSSSSDSSSRDTDNDSDANWTESNTNQTIICKDENAEEPTKKYSLRSHTGKAKEVDKTAEICNILSSVVGSTASTLISKPQTPPQEKVLKNMREKRDRTISMLKNSVMGKNKPPRIRRKVPIKIVPIRKNRRKSDSPKKAVTSNRRSSSLENKQVKFDKSFVNDFHLTSDEENEQPKVMETRSRRAKNKTEPTVMKKHEAASASDAEAEKLVSGLKEFGIHLMYNKSPKNVNAAVAPTKEKQDVDKKTDVPPASETVEPPEKKLSMASACPKRIYTLRDAGTWSTILFDTEIHMKFDEAKAGRSKTYDVNILTKKLDAVVYFDDEDIDIPVKITTSSFVTILDIPSKINILIPKRASDRASETPSKAGNNDACKSLIQSDNVDQEVASSGVLMDTTTDDSNSSPKSNRKRKAKIEEESQVAKKSKTCNEIKILQTLDVDGFLNTVHGQS